MKFNSLSDWLNWQESLNPQAIDLGLERVREVWQRMGGFNSQPVVITVGGTNGKGSSIAMLEAILIAAGYRVGCYTSPHLMHYNERIRVNAEPVDDKAIMGAFDKVEQVRGETELTFFEYGTLAAFAAFAEAKVQVALLEVGLGGRLDAVNILDADGALVATVDLDHQQWLGNDRESIGFEKAGIFRGGKPAVYSGLDAPQSLINHAEQIGALLSVYGKDYDFERDGKRWNLRNRERIWRSLVLPAMEGEHQMRNAAGVLVLLEALKDKLNVNCAAVEQGLSQLNLAARQQYLPGKPAWLLDVAHNPQALSELSGKLARVKPTGKVWAVFGMLADKDAKAAFQLLAKQVDEWALCTLSGVRGQSSAGLAAAAKGLVDAQHLREFDAVAAAMEQVSMDAGAEDLVIVFGSFHTVGEAMQWLDNV